MPSSSQRVTATVAGCLCLALAACTGNIDGKQGGGTEPPTAGSPQGPGAPNLPPVGMTPQTPDRSAAGCKKLNPGPSPLRRLNRDEYAAAVRDLLGDAGRSAVDLPPEERALGFNNSAESRSVSDSLANRYVATAEKVAATTASRISALVTCDPGKDGEMACLDRFLDSFGKRAWRRPLEAAERENLKRAYTEGKTSTFAEGIEAVVQVMLLSPQFLYRVERGVPVPGADYLRLSPWEVASRLSFLLWGSTPDDALLAAAEGGKLATADGVLAQAQRMLKDPRAAQMVANFSDQWLRLDELGDLDKEAMVYPTFTPALREPLHREAQALIDQVIWKGDGKVSTLLTAPYTFVNGPLAQFYGIKGVTGDAFQQVMLPADQRSGLLTTAGLLAVLGVPDDTITSLVFRGLFVRERLLCQPVADPPAGATDMNPPVTPMTTGRESSEARQTIALCGACHSQMDPLGYAFENFDGAGLWRTSDHGKPVDASGKLTGTDADGTFNNAVDLSRKLATSKTVQECVATQWFRFGYGRQETDQDTCTVDTLRKSFAASGGNVRDLLLALTQTDAFLFRSKGDQP
jgi:hypothetical protein